MMNYLPYIIIAAVAIVLAVLMRIQARAAARSAEMLEARTGDLERKLAALENTFRDELRRMGEEKDLKMTQLREDLRTTLDSFVEATGNKLAENAAIQKSRLDQLAAKIIEMSRQESRPRQTSPPAEAQSQAAARPQEPVQSAASSQPASPRQSTAHEKAKRLARLIVSDIVLYNQAAVEEGIRNNTFAELLAHEIQEARTLYAQRVSEEVRKGTSYLEEAFADLIARKKRELGIS